MSKVNDKYMKMTIGLNLSYLCYAIVFELIASIILIKKLQLRNMGLFTAWKIFSGNNRRVVQSFQAVLSAIYIHRKGDIEMIFGFILLIMLIVSGHKTILLLYRGAIKNKHDILKEVERA